MTTTNPRSLPTELWYKVFEHVNKDHDLVDLWMTYRNVCKSWRNAAEAVFCENHLPNMSIDFQFGEQLWKVLREEEGGDDNPDNDAEEDFQPTFFALSCDFSHVSEDKAVAYFEMEEVDDSYLPFIKSSITDYTESEKFWWTTFMKSEPHHYVRIRRECNDTLVYGVAFDWEKRELGIDWRKTVTALFREEMLYNTLLGKWSEEHQAWSAKLGDKVTRGELGMEAVLGMVVKAFGKGSEDCYKEARRARFRELFRQDEELNFSDKNFESMNQDSAEKAVLKTLKEMRFMAGLEENSDEGDGSESEEDEWEDDEEDEEEDEE